MNKSNMKNNHNTGMREPWGVGATCIGVESGGMGDASPAVEKSAGDVPPEIMIFQYLCLDTFANIAFSNIFEIKWSKSEEKLNFGGRWVWVPNMNPPPPPPPKQNFVPTPRQLAPRPHPTWNLWARRPPIFGLSMSFIFIFVGFCTLPWAPPKNSGPNSRSL